MELTVRRKYVTAAMILAYTVFITERAKLFALKEQLHFLKTLIYPGNVVTERTVCSTSKAHSYTHSHQGAVSTVLQLTHTDKFNWSNLGLRVKYLYRRQREISLPGWDSSHVLSKQHL